LNQPFDNQVLVKGDAVGFKRYTKDGKDLEEVICVNPVSVKVKYAQGQMVEARQYPDENPGIGEGLELPVDQVLHLKWDAPSFSPRGSSLVLPAFQSIELLRDYRRAEQAIAKRWATPFRLLKVGDAFGQKKNSRSSRPTSARPHPGFTGTRHCFSERQRRHLFARASTAASMNSLRHNYRFIVT
jgi:hypothetical protein